MPVVRIQEQEQWMTAKAFIMIHRLVVQSCCTEGLKAELLVIIYSNAW
jgi:hypothetical protein